ncbi:MAG: T9SS type A sorting domain-containing protein, partial [Chitinophagaceae bacterium]|nr:T9SS type A sorting domain-containing protein [Chitinophagaceae bacterium]
GDFNNVQILNAIGQRVFETQLNTGVHVVSLDVTTWPVGNYIVKLTGNKSYTTRILVQH